jgi:uncharacterized membrane protein
MNLGAQFQSLMAALLVASMAAAYASPYLFAAVFALFAAITAVFLRQIKARDADNYAAYRAFAVGTAIIALYIGAFSPSLTLGTFVQYAVYLFALALGFLLLFKARYSRNTVNGTVLSSGSGYAVVRTNFDFSTGVQEGVYAVLCSAKPKRGARVRIALKKHPFSKPLPYEIIG